MKHLRRFNESLEGNLEEINDIFTVEVADHFNLVRISYDEYNGQAEGGGPLERNKSTDPSIYYIEDYFSRPELDPVGFVRIEMAISNDNAELFKLKYLSLFEERLSKIGFKMSVKYYYGKVSGRIFRRNFTEVTMIIEAL